MKQDMKRALQTTYIKGIFAEYLAAAFLLVKGYRILKLRYKCKHGEVDIICKKGNAIIFVEVKYRPTLDQALFAIDRQKYKRIQSAALHFLKGTPIYTGYDLRIDAIVINRRLFVSHEKCIIL
ncbi:MAG: YraN family protein [Holosporales bacterium]|jgi:putative endonuclease|nr:YraN family protein [Holosporales bacterium]